MKFIVDAMQLSSVAKLVIKGLNTKDPHSQTVLKLNDDKTKLTIYCTTQTTFFKGALDVSNVDYEDSETVVEWSVDGSQLKTILSILPSAVSIPVEFEMNDSAKNFVVKSHGNTFKLPVYGTISPYKEEKTTKITLVPANDFIAKFISLGKVTSSAIEDENNGSSCLHLVFEKDNFKLMGTDMFSLAEVEEKLEIENENETTILVSSSQLSLLGRSFDGGEQISLVETPTKFGYFDERGILSLVAKSSLTPLSYQMIKTRTSDDCYIKINSSDFKEAISALGKLATNSDDITMTIKDREVILSNINEDTIKVELLDSNIDEESITFTKQSLQVLEGLFTENIKLSWPNTEYGKMVKITNYLKDDNDVEKEDTKTFIGVVANDD